MSENVYTRKDSTQISELISFKRNPHNVIAEVIGDEFVGYRQIWERAVSFKEKVAYPLHIDFEISFMCNLKCQMCVMGLPEEERSRYGGPGKKLKFETFKAIVDEGVPRGLKSVGFNGINEPLLQKDIAKWIEYAKDNGVLDIMFNTNGLLLDEDVSESLIKSGLTRIMISMDAATSQTYKKVRRSGDYNIARRNLEKFIDIKKKLKKVLPMVRVSFIKMSNNVHEQKQFMELWQDKVDFFSIQRYGNPLVKGEKYFNDFEQLHIEKEIEKISFKCPQPWVRLMIRYNGDINPCCGLHGHKLIVGNVYEDNIEDVWRSQKMNILRKIHKHGEYKENEICSLCAASAKYV
jgi:radical SAM protein with 4Fe4S-binding SPASM domain